MLFLSMDFGTSALKLSIVDENGVVHDWSKQDYPYLLLPGEMVELDPKHLFHALFLAANQLSIDLRSRVECVCYDTFSPSLVLMDDAGELVYPNIITHLDRRSRAQSDYICSVIGNDNYMNISGFYPFAGGCSAMTLLWFRLHRPDLLAKIRKVGHLTTYLHKKFTGHWMVDLVNASMLGLYETTTQGSWSKELLTELKLPKSWFPDIYTPGTTLGFLLPDIAASLGLPSEIPVAVGTNDVAAAQMGAQNQKTGQIMNTAGSSEMVSILSDIPAVSPHYYLRNSAIPGLWQIYATTAGGFAVDWFYNQFCRDLTKEDFYGIYLIQTIEQYADKTHAKFSPYLTGDRQCLEKKTGAWHGLTLSTTREEMLSALLKSIQGVLYTTIKEAETLLPLEHNIKISGGMVTPSYLRLKELEIPDYTFEQVDNCPILGNVALVKYHNYQSA